MGILADLFVATPDLANDYAMSQLRSRAAHIKRYAPVEFRGLTFLEFGKLWAVLAGEKWQLKAHMLQMVDFGDGHESWLCRFPDTFVGLLVSIPDSKVDEYAAAWARTDELSASGFTPQDTRKIIVELVRLANQARSTQSEMYLWGSL
jgi:hypothetical protein